jgi:hypothetical protein
VQYVSTKVIVNATENTNEAECDARDEPHTSHLLPLGGMDSFTQKKCVGAANSIIYNHIAVCKWQWSYYVHNQRDG